MKKSKVLDVLDNLFWYIIYLLPVIGYLVCGRGDNNLNMQQFFDQFFNLGEGNLIYDSLISLFGSEGVITLLSSNSYVFSLTTYFISCMILHLAVDVLLFIPRFCHNLMDNFANCTFRR